MKNLLKTGLLALTVAFGVVSCDKNGIDDIESPVVGTIENQNYTKVTFGESVGLKVNKPNQAGKTAGDFDHVYSSEPQVITIKEAGDAGEIVFMGTFTAGNIGGGIIADANYAVPIILQNGDYVAETLNQGNLDEIDYLPYNSRAAFSLDANTETIQLAATLLKGFLIVDVENAPGDSSRVQGATYSVGVDGADATLVGPDDEGDFHGYFLDGTYQVDVTYLYNSEAVVIEGSQRVVPGRAYTVLLPLVADDAVSTRTTTETLMALESEIGSDGLGRDINTDDDLLDSLERIATTLFTTTAGIEDAGVLQPLPSWSVVSDKDINISSDVEESTEAAITTNVNPDIDSDEYDTISRVVTTTQVTVEGTEISSDDVPGVWSILVDYSSPGFGGTPADPVTGDPVDTLSDFGDWVVVEAADTEEFTSRSRARTVVIVGDEDATPPVGDLIETQTDFPNPDYVTPNGVDTWDVTGTYGGEEVLGALTYNDAPVDTSVQFYTRIGTQAYSVNAAGNVETYNVVDAQDGSILDGATRNVETAAAQPGLSREASNVADTLNPNYVAPSDSNDGDVGDAAMGTVTIVNMNPSSLAGLITIVFNGGVTTDIVAGTYDIVVTGLSGVPATVTVDITDADLADGVVTVTVNTVGNANTVVVS